MRAHRYPLLALVVMAVVAGAALARRDGAAAYEHIVNGGFENGTSGWTTFSDQATLDVVAGGAVGAPEGAWAGRVALIGGGFSLRQSSRLGLGAGQYHFSARFRAESSSVEVYAIIEATAPTTGPVRIPGEATVAGTWLTIDGDVRTDGSDNVAISIRGSGNAGDVVYIDDVRLEGAPPATMTRTSTPTRTLTPTPGAQTTGTPQPTETPTSLPVQIAIGNALVNGGFEDRGPDGGLIAWEKYGGVLSSASAPVRSGSGAARFESATDSTKWVHQAVLVSAGDWYHFDAWVAHADADVSSAFLRISWYESPDASGSAIDTVDSATRLDEPSQGYRFLTTGSVQAPAGARTARARIMLTPASAGHGEIFIDDAAFGPAGPAPPPPPGVVAAPDPDSDTGLPGGTAGSGGRSSARRASSSASQRIASTSSSVSQVVINEVLYDAASPGSDSDAEWVELYNRGDVDVDVAGWTLRDGSSVDVLPSLVVPAGGFAVVAASELFRPTYPRYSGPLAIVAGRLGNGLGNDGDALHLTDASLSPVDAVSWGDDVAAFDPPVDDVPAGHSIERRTPGGDTDSAADFIDNESPSPGMGMEPAGRADEGVVVPAVEILAAEGSNTDAFIYGVIAASAVALVAAVAWRVAPFVRHRLRGRA